MSFQAFSWTEIQARTPWISEWVVPDVSWLTGYAREALGVVAVFLPAFAFMEAALGVWRMCADLGWAGAFFLDAGILSHWQVWFALAAFTQGSASYLNRLVEKMQPGR